MTRVLSLLPAATDIVVALGAADHLVGVTHECDVPTVCGAVPRVTRSAIDSRATPDAVDRSVRAADARGDALFELDETRIAELRPDLVLTQAVCDVCAVRETDVRALAARLSPRPQVITLAASTLEGMFDDIMRVAEAMRLEPTARALLAGLRSRVRRVHDTLRRTAPTRPRAAVLEWTDPVYAAGHWVPTMVQQAGGIDVLAEPGSHSRAIGVADVGAAEPDIVIVAPCGYGITRAAEEARRMLVRPEWEQVALRKVWAVDANTLVSRPGPYLVDGIETLAHIFHPALFPPPRPERAVDLGRPHPGNQLAAAERPSTGRSISPAANPRAAHR